MASGKLTAVDDISTPAAVDQFLTGKVKLRGQEFSFRELSTEQYDKLVKMATDEDDMVDRTVLLRMMIAESSVEPKLTPEGLAKLPYPISRRIGLLVNNMHYFDEIDAEEGGSPNP